MRRSATKTETEINGRKFRQPDQRNAKQQQQNKNRHQRRGVRRQQLAVRKKNYRARVVGTTGVMVKILVQRRAGRHRGGEQPESEQQTSNRWFGNPADARIFLWPLHLVNNQPCRSNGCKPENGIILFVILACHHCVLHALTKKQPLFPKAALRFFQFTPSRPAVHPGKRWRSWWRSRSSRRG